MLNIKLIRTEPDLVKEAMRKRNNPMDIEIDNILQLDKTRRELLTKVENMKAEQNKASKEIPAFKKEGKDVSSLMSHMKSLSEQVKNLTGEISELENKQQAILLTIPNIPHHAVPVGKNEDDNVEVRRVGTLPQFDFEPLPHWELGEKLGILDPERAAKVTGARFHFYKGLGARLERAVTNFFLDTHEKNGFTEILPPFLVNRASMTGTGQLPKFEDGAFKITDTDYFLIPTSEVPVTNLHRDEILDGKTLPIKYCAYSANFRSEAGSAGRDTRGLIRQHQFNKVEMVKFVKPESSHEELESLTKCAENLLEMLGLPFRTVILCTGDMGFAGAKAYDVEVYMPSYKGYKEISSCTNFEDFQARRANIRYKENVGDKAQFVHTLNGSGLAVGRTTAAILENYQNADGSITVPEVLRKYMGVSVIL